MYEDELPETMPAADYAAWFERSEITVTIVLVNEETKNAFDKFLSAEDTASFHNEDEYRRHLETWSAAVAWQKARDMAAVLDVIDEWEASHALGERKLVFGHLLARKDRAANQRRCERRRSNLTPYRT